MAEFGRNRQSGNDIEKKAIEQQEKSMDKYTTSDMKVVPQGMTEAELDKSSKQSDTDKKMQEGDKHVAEMLNKTGQPLVASDLQGTPTHADTPQDIALQKAGLQTVPAMAVDNTPVQKIHRLIADIMATAMQLPNSSELAEFTVAMHKATKAIQDVEAALVVGQ